jgi:hypothetical protein
VANTIITPSVIARRALATLYNTTVLAGLVWRDFDEDFAGKQGDTVTIRTPAVFQANVFNRGTGIVLQDIKEGGLPVTLDTIADVSFPVTAEELTLKIDDFSERVLTPAMEAIVQKVDSDLATQLLAAATVGGTDTKAGTATAATDLVNITSHPYRNGDQIKFPTLTGGAGLTAATVTYFVRDATDNTFKVALTRGGAAVDITSDASALTTILAGGGTVTSGGATVNANALIDARTKLTANLVPTSERYGVYSPEQAGALLKDPLMRDADKRGDTDGLREAAIGRKFGLDNYETQALSGLTAAGVAFHRTAVTLASRTLSLPMGADSNRAAVENYKGLGLRVVKDYDINKKQDIVSIDFLYGTKRTRPSAAVALTLV